MKMSNLTVTTSRLEPASAILRNSPHFRGSTKSGESENAHSLIKKNQISLIKSGSELCEKCGRNCPVAPVTATSAPNRPMQPNNPYYAHIAHMVKMGSDGQGAYSLSLPLTRPRFNRDI